MSLFKASLESKYSSSLSWQKATFHSKQSLDYGSNIVGGVSHRLVGDKHMGKPVFGSVREVDIFQIMSRLEKAFVWMLP
jgi:succinyl-CoA synthetase alpha subunit